MNLVFGNFLTRLNEVRVESSNCVYVLNSFNDVKLDIKL